MSNGRWFRFYDDTLNDPKSLKLSDKTFRIWVGMLCAASKNDGILPPFDDLLILLRAKADKLQPAIEELIAVGLIDHDDNGMRPHNWNTRQYKSDVSTDRVKRFRNGKRNVSETPPETEAETDTERKEDATKGVAPKLIFFESGVIRLTKTAFEKWRDAFTNLDLKAELLGLTQWASQQSDWYFAVSGALAKRNREMGLRQKQKSGPQVPLYERPLTDFIT